MFEFGSCVIFLGISLFLTSHSNRAGIAPLLIWVTNFDLVKAFEFANVKFSYGLALLIPLLP